MTPSEVQPAAPAATSETAPGEGVPELQADLAVRPLSIKEGETFLYSNDHGNLNDEQELGLGLYHRDTRFLSHFELRVSGREPVLLSSSSERAYLAHVDMTNPELHEGGEVVVRQQTLNIRRTRAIHGRLFERIRVKNYDAHGVRITLSFELAADFADIFAVRGVSRERRGRQEAPELSASGVTFRYQGIDGVRRRTVVAFEPRPASVLPSGRGMVVAEFELELEAHATKLVTVTVDPLVAIEDVPATGFEGAVHRLRRSYEDWERESTAISTDNELFNQLLVRGLRDLRALRTPTEYGPILAAGVPWYVAVFGRDSLITSHQLLAVNPNPARDALKLLAHLQGTEDDPWRDEEPGKILHEIRRGELASAGLVPHTRYYGTVDATPLFVLLYAMYFRWTGDVGFARELLPNVLAALQWIDHYGDLDGDGFVEYRCRSPRGITNQGWKDSFDSVVHEDGRLATGFIALSEVQGYVYLAKERVAGVFDALGDAATARRLRREAALLKRRFNEDFWMEDKGYFAMALDGDKRQVRTITSNPGHGLYCDIVEPSKAELLTRGLLQPDMFSGWGIRTMSKGAAAYNPMSYHNGSVWPHDNALIAAGLKRYGFVRATNRVATAMFDTAVHADYMRLPELFCGFTRRAPNRPVAYPVACSPQAWAAGSPFLLLQAILGISARAHENTLTINKPHLPPWLNTVELRNLKVGQSSLSLVFRREGEITSFSMIDRSGDVRVVMEE